MSDEAIDITDDIAPAPVEAQSTEEQDNSPDLVSNDTAEPDGSSAENEKPRAQRRIEQLVGDKKAAMEYGNYWKDKYEAQHTPVVPTKEPEILTQPTLDEFDFDQEKFIVANNTYTQKLIDQKIKEAVNNANEQSTRVNAQNQIESAWNDRVSTFTQAHDDFIDVVSNPALSITGDMSDVMKTSELGPDIAYHLGKNPSEAVRISQLPPMAQAMALGKIEASLSKPVAKQKQATTAPAPISPVGNTQPTTSIANESIGDFMKRRNQEDADRRAGLR